MRKLLILALLCGSLTMSGTTYFISPTGNDSNNGSSSSPWKTLAYACSKATTSGDIIHVTAGTYTETAKSLLAVGVSIEGDGNTSIIKSNYAASLSDESDASICLTSSSSSAVNGNQSISYIRLEGNNLTGKRGIAVNYRNNVSIHHCTIIDFDYSGVAFNGSTSSYPSSTSTRHNTNNSVHDCIITNCSHGMDGAGNYGHVFWSGEQDFLIYNNTLDGRTRSAGNNGDVLNGIWGKGVKIYNNTLYKNDYEGTAWNFFSEIFFTEGGMEIYGNVFNGLATLDIVDVRKGTYTFGVKIYNNEFLVASQAPATAHGIQAINFEERGAVQDVYVYNNHFKNINTGVQFDGLATNTDKVLIGGNIRMERLYIYYNLFENVGNTTNNFSSPISIKPEGSTSNLVWDNIYIDNNTIISGTTYKCLTGVLLETGGTMSNIYIRNNIIKGVSTYPVYFSYNMASKITGSTIYVQNNLYYLNGTNAIGYNGISITGINQTALIPANPSFVSSSDFHLTSGSPAIDAGIHIATPSITTDYDDVTVGNIPEIGAYEYGSSASQPVIPVYQSSAVENTTPSLLELNYNLTLANIIPAASSFSVLVNSAARTVNSVVVSGTKVQLTLASPVIYGDAVTVTYAKPAVNPLQTSSGGLAVAISTQTVTNKVNSVNPVYVSSAVENATPSLLQMTYNMTLANIVPASSSFSVLVNSAARTVNSVVVSGTRVQLTLANRIVSGDVVKVSYTKPVSNPLQTTAGAIAVSITSQPAINNCINAAPTAIITAPVMNSSFSSSSNITIAADALDADGSVTIVEFFNGNTKLGSSSVAPYLFTWNNVPAGTYSLTVIASDNLNAKTISSVVSISVLSRTGTLNKHPFIRISNPRKGNSYEQLSTITIDAIASDPDGTISKVEFYNGPVQLVELTSPPYSYTWKDVPAGSYSITAIATDNLNDTTKSSPIEFVVGARVKYGASPDIINLYPNPNNGHFSIEFINPILNDKSEIIITDLAGKQVYNGPVLKEEILKQFDLSEIKSGMYVMIIKDKEILTTKKFIKK